MRILFTVLIKILRYVHKFLNVMRELFLNILLLIMISLFAWMLSRTKKNNVIDAKNIPDQILTINLQNAIIESPIQNIPTNGFYSSYLGNNYANRRNTSIFEIIQKIKQAETDPKILGILINADNTFSGNQVTLEYFGKKLNEFKKSKKPIVAIGRSYSQCAYYLSSFANKIFLLPHGSIQLNGMSTKKLFLKKFLDIFQIHMHVFKVGQYKAAVDPILKNFSSKKNKKMDQYILQHKWQKFLEIIARNRKIPVHVIFPNPKKIDKYLNKNNNNFAKYALHYGLIDRITTSDDLQKYVIRKFFHNKKLDNYYSIDINQYKLHEQIVQPDSNKISVILADGVIGNNVSESSSMNIKYILDEIDKAKQDDRVKAVVLRINSPGGNTEDSEIIRKKLLELHKFKKPLVICMGEISASGGYWIATAGDYIVAHSTTTTGSIGIFSVIPTFEKTLSLIGIKVIQTSTRHNNSFNMFNDMSPQYKKRMMLDITHGYEKFIKIVAKSRHKSYEYVKKIANGQVWLGEDARKIGLVDQIGDLDDSIEKAAELAKIKDFNIIWTAPQNIASKNIKNQINNLIQVILRNILRKLFSEILVNKIFMAYHRIYLMWKILTLNKLVSFYFDGYTIK